MMQIGSHSRPPRFGVGRLRESGRCSFNCRRKTTEGTEALQKAAGVGAALKSRPYALGNGDSSPHTRAPRRCGRERDVIASPVGAKQFPFRPRDRRTPCAPTRGFGRITFVRANGCLPSAPSRRRATWQKSFQIGLTLELPKSCLITHYSPKITIHKTPKPTPITPPKRATKGAVP